jgi:hypothetical protein
LFSLPAPHPAAAAGRRLPRIAEPLLLLLL